MISPTTVKGKQIYRDACDETKGWNADISDQLKRDWIKWSSQLKPVRDTGTNVPEQFFGETTESNKADGAVDTLGDGKRKDTLDQEGPKQYLSKCTNTRLGAGQGGHQHPEV